MEKGKVELNVAPCSPYELMVLVFNRLEYEEHLVSSGKGAVLILLVINNRMCGWCELNFAHTFNSYQLTYPHLHLICLSPPLYLLLFFPTEFLVQLRPISRDISHTVISYILESEHEQVSIIRLIFIHQFYLEHFLHQPDRKSDG